MLQAVSLPTVVVLSLFSQTGIAQTNSKTIRKVDTQVVAADTIPFSALPKGALSEVVQPQPDAPAPALTRVFINNVCTGSGGTGCETITSGETLTANTYSNSDAYVFVWEIGYGTGESATQGGISMSSTYLVGKLGVCISGSSYTTSCAVGSTIVGYRYEWNAGYYLGLGYGNVFQATDTSAETPYNTYSAGIDIQYVQ